MDFVARAGAIIDRAHRVAGVLLICVVVLGLVTMCQATRNAALNNDLKEFAIRHPVIVVPDAAVGLYSPTNDDRLTLLFTNLMTQLYNTFTPETITKQYEKSRNFFAPALLTDSSVRIERRLRDVMADRRSSLFVPDESSIDVKKYEKNGVEYRDVNMTGSLQTIIAGTVAETLPLRVEMTFQKTYVTPANPYGLTLAMYREKPLIGPAPTPLAPGPQTMQTDGQSGAQ